MIRVQETAVAVAGLAAAGCEKEAGSLLLGILAAAEAFGHRLPEMYAGEQRTGGAAPVPTRRPAAPRPCRRRPGCCCRPRSWGSAPTPRPGSRSAPCAPPPALRPLRSAPLGEIGLTGLRVAGTPFSVRGSRLGPALVEDAADGLRLGT